MNPCLEVAMYDSDAGSHGHFHKISEPSSCFVCICDVNLMEPFLSTKKYHHGYVCQAGKIRSFVNI